MHDEEFEKMKQLVDLSGKKIIVVGASSGIGRETALIMSQLGAQIIMIARRENELKKALEELDGSGHGYFAFDISELNNISDILKRITDEYGQLDGMVYSAGIGKSMSIALFSPEKVESVMKINYFGFVEFVRQLSKKGRMNTGARIVAVSSIAAICGDPAHTVYSGSKAALEGSVRCLAKELSKKGICINCVAPAMIETPMYSNYSNTFGEDSATNNLLDRQYLGLGKPEDVANAISFLISPAARFITGTTLYVDGGYTSC